MRPLFAKSQLDRLMLLCFNTGKYMWLRDEGQRASNASGFSARLIGLIMEGRGKHGLYSEAWQSQAL